MKKTFGSHNLAAARAARTGQRKEALTDKERVLVQGLAGGLSKAAAFRKAGYASGVRQDEVLGRARLVRYLDELRKRQVERLDYSIENLCARLEHIAFSAVDEGQYAAAVSAVMGIAKMMGHLADKTEIEMHIISKPAREPTKEITLSPEEWQRQFAPKAIQ